MRSLFFSLILIVISGTAMADFDERGQEKTLNPKALDHLKGTPPNAPKGIVPEAKRREAPAKREEQPATQAQAPVDRLTAIHNEWIASARFLREYSALDTDFVPFRNVSEPLKSAMLNPGENAKDLEVIVASAKGREEEARAQIREQYRTMVQLVSMGQYALAGPGDKQATDGTYENGEPRLVVDAQGRALKRVAGRISFDRFHQLRMSFYGSTAGRTGFDGIIADLNAFPRRALQRLTEDAIRAGVRRPNAAHFIRSREEMREWTAQQRAQFLIDRAQADTHELLRSTDSDHETNGRR